MDGVMMPSRLRSAPCTRSTAQHHTFPKISAAPDRCRVAARSRPACVFYSTQNGSSTASSGHPDRGGQQEETGSGVRLNGRISREALEAWNKRVGAHYQRAPADVVQPLFNDLHLYPLRTQVFEMLVSARDCARRAELTLTFGEFCLFVAELRRRALRRTPSGRTKRNEGSSPHSESEEANKTPNGTVPEPPSYEVFLGGSCNPTTWRWDVAMPTLDKMGITYFNPQVKEWSKDLIEIEHNAKQSARVLFFVLDAETRAAAAVVEAAHLAASTRARHLVLVLQPYRRGQHIGGELVPEQEYLDLSRGQAILQEVAERQNLLVFNDLDSALKCTQRLLRGNDPQFPLNKWESHTPAIAKHIVNLKHTFDNADENNVGSLSLNETIKAIKSLANMDVTTEELKTIINSENDLKNGCNETIYRCNSSNAINGSFSNLNSKVHSDSVDFEMFCFILAELNADLTNSNDMTMSTSYLRNLKEQINKLLIVDSEKASISLNKRNSDSEESLSDDLNDHQMTSHEKDIRLDSSSLIDLTKKPIESIRWRPGTGKWRQLLNCVQEAVYGFMSKLEISGIINRQSCNQRNKNIRNQEFDQNKMEVSKSEKNVKIDSNIEEKVKNETISSKSVYKSSNAKNNIDRNMTDNSNRMPFLSKPAPRKLSLIIPKVPQENDRSTIFSPQTSKRLDGLAEAVREEIPQKDVYLGGAGVNRTKWRQDIVIPMLKSRNFTYYIPSMNDYNRMFSAPPINSAVDKFVFDESHAYAKLSKSSSENTIMTTKTALSMKIFTNPGTIDKSNIVNNNMTTSSHNIDINDKLNISNVDKNEKLSSENGRVPHKHERSPTFEDDHPEKRPKYSRDESPNSKKIDLDDDEIELRDKELPEVGYPLTTFNRLSASDFYKIPENASPAPFRGMYDERQLKNSRVLLFGVTRDTRCLTPMVLAAHWIGLRPRAVVLCVQPLNRTDDLTEQAVKDYNRGRMYLSDLARRENVPIFDNLEEATQCVIEKLENRNY